MTDFTIGGVPLNVLGDGLCVQSQIWTTGQPSPWTCFPPPIACQSGPAAIADNSATAITVAMARTATGSGDQSAGAFYTDQGALCGRFPDRLFIGAATDNPGAASRDITPRDWLSDVMGPTNVGAWALWGAQGASIARMGSIGFLGASRTSDARAQSTVLGYIPTSIGVAAFAVADDTTSPTEQTATGFYAHVIRENGVNYKPSFGAEIEVVNLGGATATSNPYQINVGGGTYCIQAGSGGGQTGTSDASAVMTVAPNPSGFQKGIIFQATALTGTTGSAADGGFGSAIVMGRNQGIEWYAPDGHSACILRSTVTSSALGSRLEFQNSGTVLVNSSGYGVLSVSNSGGVRVYNTMQLFGSTDPTFPAGIQIQPAPGGDPNLALRPAVGGTLDVTAPVDHVGATLPATANAGMLHLTINGTNVCVPLYTPASFP